MLDRRWQGLAMLLLICLLCNASGSFVGANMIPSPENSPSEFAKIVQSKQTKQARVFSGGADHRSLRSLANTGEEVILTVPNDQLEHIAEFPEEAELWVAANVVRFLPATRITHVVAGDDVLADCSAIQPGGPCFKQNNLPALASYAYNDYYQKMASTGATCSFNGTATTTTADPSSGSCVFAGSSMAGGSNTSVPGASHLYPRSFAFPQPMWDYSTVRRNHFDKFMLPIISKRV
uniref:X8 domain-containing protein n=1 Tax=Oryza brachyantha TaxID=4533 RepID=J3LP64_ORYBR